MLGRLKRVQLSMNLVKRVKGFNIKDKYVIVGVDPGTTVGLSVLDLEEMYLRLFQREVSRCQMLKRKSENMDIL